MLEISLLSKKFINFRIKNAKFSGYCFYVHTKKYWDFQICISVPLKVPVNLANVKNK